VVLLVAVVCKSAMLKSLVSILHTINIKAMENKCGASLAALIQSKFVHGMFQITGSPEKLRV